MTDSARDADTHGATPNYVEITSAALVGGPDRLVLAQTFAGAVPQRMPDEDTFTYVGFNLRGKDRDVTVSATCDEDGWHADVDGAGFPGELHIRGNTLEFEVPWAVIGGPAPFTWQSSSSWTRSTLLNTYYAFDSAPNYSRARFPK